MKRIDKTFYDFLDLSIFAVVGALAGITFGWFADLHGWAGNPYIEGVTRLLAGAGDSIGEVSYIIYLRLKKKHSSVEIYVLGKILGMMTGPLVQAGVRLSGLNPYGVAGVLYASAYSNFDNLFGSIIYFGSQVKERKSLKQGWKSFWRQPYQVGNIFAVFLIGLISLMVRLSGFSPVKNLLAGAEAGLMDVDSVIAAIWAWVAYYLAGQLPR